MSAAGKRVLIAGIGNIFFGDDAFGVEVAQRLSARRLPDGVAVRDFGIRGFDLAYALVDGWDTVILVDAISRQEKPGTVFVLEPDLDEVESSFAQSEVQPHGMDPVHALRLARSFGELPRRVLLVGCEPAELGGEDGVMGLSREVGAAVDVAVAQIERLLAELLLLASTSAHAGEARVHGSRS